jgi:hypothetical protein
MGKSLVKINKLILRVFLISIIFILLIFIFNRIYIYSQTLSEEEKGRYAALVNHIKDIYSNVRWAIWSLYYRYNSRNFSRVLWSDLAY